MGDFQGGGAFVEQARRIGRYGWLLKRRQAGKKHVGRIERTSFRQIFISFLELVLLGHSLLSRAHQGLYALVGAVALHISNKLTHNNHQEFVPIVKKGSPAGSLLRTVLVEV